MPCSLSDLAWHLYDTPKHNGGDQIASMWANGDLKGIAEHNSECLDLTWKIWNDYRGILF